MGQHVRVDVSGLERFRGQVTAGGGPIQKALRQWAERFRGFIQERFVTMSRGGWTPLKPQTIAQRRAAGGGTRGKKLAKLKQQHAKAAAKHGVQSVAATKIQTKLDAFVAGNANVAILRDTGTLFNALSPAFHGAPGAIEQEIPGGIRVGYGGPHRYSGKGSKASIADIASFHQEGAGHLPIRQIIVAPPQAVVDAMASDMDRALKQLADETKSG